MTKKKTKPSALRIKPKPAKLKPLSYSDKLKRSFINKQIERPTPFTYNYHSTAFLYFQSMIGPWELNKRYRNEFWEQKTEIPRVLNIVEFKKLISSDVKTTIQKNLKPLPRS